MDALALSSERQSARMSKIKNSGFDQYDADPTNSKQFRAAGVESVNIGSHCAVVIGKCVSILRSRWSQRR